MADHLRKLYAFTVLCILMSSSWQKEVDTTIRPSEPNFSIKWRITTKSTVTSGRIIPFKSVQDVCKFFNVSMTNCSCSLFTVQGHDMFPDLCALTKHLEKNATTLLYSATLSRTYASIIIMASSFGVIGNLLVIVVALRNRKSLSRCQLLFAELAICDLTFAILQSFIAVPLYWTNKWVYGEVMCKIFTSGMQLGSLVSIGFILIIALERYLGILYPLSSKLTDKNVQFIVGGNIIAAIGSIIPLLVVTGVNKETGRCEEHWPNKNADSEKFNWFLLVFYFTIPVSIIIVFYTLIIRHLNSKINTYIFNNTNDTRAKDKRGKENRRIMRILIAVLVAFVISVLPIRLVWLYFNFVNYKVSKTVYMTLAYIGLLTFPLHVAVNPVIYSVIDKRWRNEVITWFRSLKWKKRRPNMTSGSTTPRPSIDGDMIRVHKNYGGVMETMKSQKDDKGRNLSVDHCTLLLSYNPNQSIMASARINKAVIDDSVFES